MTRAEELLERQSRWQRARRARSWPEKIREVERLRSSVEAFRRMRENRVARPETQAGASVGVAGEAELP